MGRAWVLVASSGAGHSQERPRRTRIRIRMKARNIPVLRSRGSERITSSGGRRQLVPIRLKRSMHNNLLTVLPAARSALPGPNYEASDETDLVAVCPRTAPCRTASGYGARAVRVNCSDRNQLSHDTISRSHPSGSTESADPSRTASNIPSETLSSHPSRRHGLAVSTHSAQRRSIRSDR